MRILVCGGRSYPHRHIVFDCLDAIARRYGVERIIHGCASGADKLSSEWAAARGVAEDRYPADWSVGRRAGPDRNSRMLLEGAPDGVVAFPGGRGTDDMIRQARSQGITVWMPRIAWDNTVHQ
ncbi:DUF2493 domain-containing protein [Acetobacter sacchari]|uniref:DUF2493 domain-containing protein n=1 Tax=Acetobacter sacchari TaxID=2661687 RepID=A0ABS3LZT2_9PROT|nr:DUF2493 domain-containing protein [Acetobacter sacchari]